MDRRLIITLLFIFFQGLIVMFAGAAVACGAVGGPQQDYQSDDCHSPVLHPHEGADTSTSNPVDLITGNKFLQQFDAPLAGGLSFARFYNSQHEFAGALGPGWRHVFEFSLSVRRSRMQPDHYIAQLVQGDGRRIVFRAPEANNHNAFIALDAAYGSLHRYPQLGGDRRWLWRWRDGTRLYFNDQQQLSAAHSAGGHRLVFRYDQQGRLERVANRYGSHLQLHYGEQRLSVKDRTRLQSVTLPDGRRLHYAFDANGVLTSVKHDKKLRWRFAYADDRFAALTQVLDAQGQLLRSIRYNAQGRVSYSALGEQDAAVSMTYHLPVSPDKTGETVVTPANPDAPTTRYRWRYRAATQQRQWLSAVGPGCSVCPPVSHNNHYDQHGRLVRQIFAHSLEMSRSYDPLGRLTDVRLTQQKQGGVLVKVAHATPITTAHIRYQYLSNRVDAPLVQVSFDSVAAGKRLVRRFEYDSLERLTGITEHGYEPDPGGLKPTPAGWTVHKWRVIKRRWSIGWVDFGAAAGLPAWVDGPLPGLRDKQLFVYNRRGLKVARFGPYRRTATWSYGANDLPSAQTIEGETHQFEYDEQNRTIRRGPQSAPIRTQYNELNQRVAIAVAGMPTIGISYDRAGDIARLFEPDRPSMFIPVSRLKNTRAPGLSDAGYLPDNLLARFSAQRGKRMVIKRASGEWQQTITDDFGRVVARFDSEHGHIRWYYDLANCPIARLRSGAAPEWFRYAPNGRPSGLIQAGGRNWHQRWQGRRVVARRDLYSRREWRNNASGKLLHTRVNYTDPVTGQGFERALTLDRQYDDRQRLITRDVGNGWRIRFDWSEHNRLSVVSLEQLAPPSPSTKQILLASNLRWLPLTNGQRGLRSAEWGNGIRYSIEHTPSNRPLRLSWERLDSSGLRKDIVGPIVREFDSNGRVVARRIGQDKALYDYDENGWLTSARNGAHHSHWLYADSGDRLTSETARQGKSLASFAGQTLQSTNPRPRLIKRPNGALVMLDRNGRPRWSAHQDHRVYRYLYNSDGERIGRLRIGKPQLSRWFIYENKRLHIETDAVGKPIRSYVYLDGKPFVMIQFDGVDPIVHWIHTDARGLPIAMTDRDGVVVWRQTFDPFGKLQAATNSIGDASAMPIRLPGQYVDAETGLYDNYKRTYDPDAGRYIGADPLGMRQTGLRYAYAGNSPLDTIDPLGLYEQDVHYYATLVIAMAAGMPMDDAIVIANASQFVDDSQDTEPIITNADGSLNLTETFLSRRRVLEQHHFVLDTNPTDGRDPTQVSNPESRRLTQLRAAVDGSGEREAQMFNLGVFAHAFTDTAAHRDENNLPYRVPLFPGRGGIDTALGHGIDGHFPDLTYNTCAEPGPDGELGPTDPDLIGGRRHWPNNEARTLTIQRDLFEVFQQYSAGDAALSWEELAPLLAQFNAIEESATHVHEQLYDANGNPVAWHSAEGVAVRAEMRINSDLTDFAAKLEQLNTVLNAIEELQSVGDSVPRVPASVPLYDMAAAAFQWETYFRGL